MWLWISNPSSSAKTASARLLIRFAGVFALLALSVPGHAEDVSDCVSPLFVVPAPDRACIGINRGWFFPDGDDSASLIGPYLGIHFAAALTIDALIALPNSNNIDKYYLVSEYVGNNPGDRVNRPNEILGPFPYAVGGTVPARTVLNAGQLQTLLNLQAQSTDTFVVLLEEQVGHDVLNPGVEFFGGVRLDGVVASTPPTITPAAGLSRQQGTPPSNSVIATVADAESNSGSLVVTAPSVPAGFTVAAIVNTAGTVTADLAALCSAGLGANAVGLGVSDGGLSTPGNLSVQVTANTSPLLGIYAATTVNEHASINVVPTAEPADNGSVMSLTASAPGFTGSLVGNPVTGVIAIGNAGPVSATPYGVTVTATDNCGATSVRSFNLTVIEFIFSNGFE